MEGFFMGEIQLTLSQYRWKHLFLQMENAKVHVETGIFINVLEEIRERKEKALWEAYQKSAKKKTSPRSYQRSQNSSSSARRSKALMLETPMSLGEPMAPVKTVNNGQIPELKPAECPHPQEMLSHPRGGRGGRKWFTCLKCGARWERVWESQDPSNQNQIKDAVILTLKPSTELMSQNPARARAKSAMEAPEDPATSGSARLPQVMELSEDLTPVNQMLMIPTPTPTLEDQLKMHYQFLVGKMNYTHQDAIQTLLERAQNEMEAEVIRRNAVL